MENLISISEDSFICITGDVFIAITIIIILIINTKWYQIKIYQPDINISQVKQ
jgi:hypothetical protein